MTFSTKTQTVPWKDLDGAKEYQMWKHESPLAKQEPFDVDMWALLPEGIRWSAPQGRPLCPSLRRSRIHPRPLVGLLMMVLLLRSRRHY